MLFKKWIPVKHASAWQIIKSEKAEEFKNCTSPEKNNRLQIKLESTEASFPENYDKVWNGVTTKEKMAAAVNAACTVKKIYKRKRWWKPICMSSR